MLNKLMFILFFVGLFFFPFNCFDGIKELGEFKNESASYFFFSGFVLLFFSRNFFIPIKNKLYILILVFLIWCFITTLFNFENVRISYFKMTSGTDRFIRQYFALIISTIVFPLFYYNVLIKMEIKDILFKIRKLFTFSLITASIIGFVEILIEYFGISLARVIMKVLNYFPFLEKTYFDDRMSSFADEPPFFAVYLITISGWMFSYILTNKSKLKYLPTLIVLILTFFSGSRTALIVVFIQFIVFIYIIVPKEKILKHIINSGKFLILLTTLTIVFNSSKISKEIEKKIESLDFKGNLKTSISNKSRFGMQYATLQVFLEHPLIGVGFGQQTYYSRFHYPGWAVRDNYEFKLLYKNSALKAFPPSYNMYTRMLAEIGLIGIFIMLYLFYYSLKLAKHYMKSNQGDVSILSTIILISLIGLYINLLQIDTFRLYGIWISLTILIVISKKNVKQ